MRWEEARNQTLDKWYAIRDLVGLCEPVVFIKLINDTNAMCREAEAEAERHLNRDSACYYCKWSEQYGRCNHLIDAMSVAAERRDWESVRALTLNMIGMLENMRLEEIGESLDQPSWK